MGIRGGDRVGAHAPGGAWSSPKKLLGMLVGTVLLLALAVGLWGETTSSAQTAPSTCKNIGGPINYSDSSGRLLASFNVSQRICWNYQELTYVSRPRVVAGVTDYGAAKGWRYDGLILKRDLYFAYNGVSDGGHKSVRKGSFSLCSPEGACTQIRTPKIKIFGYYDRGGYQVGTA